MIWIKRLNGVYVSACRVHVGALGTSPPCYQIVYLSMPDMSYKETGWFVMDYTSMDFHGPFATARQAMQACELGAV